jgi:small GTP-binding protein
MTSSYRTDYKVVILGASGVGKTCLGLRFVKDQFVTYTASTIGASFLVKELVFNNQKVTLQIWDTAGQERFRSMAPLYYRGAVAAILVFSITDESSFEKLKEWVRELQNNVEEPMVLAIACNKADLTDQRVVPAEVATQYANSIGALLYETSAKSNTGVSQLFHEVARRLVTTQVRSATTMSSGSNLPPLQDPLAPYAGKRSKCC